MREVELVSIIVPVYKVEKYLRECLDSILASTYTNLEIIVVDDGSPDGCPEICDEYAAKDSRIHVIHQENKGIVGARNAGLEYAHGTYVGFVDSDDMVSPVMYEQLVRALEDTGADIAACGYVQDDRKLTTTGSQEQMSYTISDRLDEQIALLVAAPDVREMTWIKCSVWNRLYRNDWNYKSFNKECWFCEDLRFNWDYIIDHKCKMVILPDVLYFYRQNDAGIMAEYYYTADAIEKRIAYVNQWRHIAENSPVNPRLKEYLVGRVVYLMHSVLRRIYATKKEQSYKAYISSAKAYMRKNLRYLMVQTDTYDKKLLITIALCCWLPPVWIVLLKLLHLR